MGKSKTNMTPDWQDFETIMSDHPRPDESDVAACARFYNLAVAAKLIRLFEAGACRPAGDTVAVRVDRKTTAGRRRNAVGRGRPRS